MLVSSKVSFLKFQTRHSLWRIITHKLVGLSKAENFQAVKRRNVIDYKAESWKNNKMRQYRNKRIFDILWLENSTSMGTSILQLAKNSTQEANKKNCKFNNIHRTRYIDPAKNSTASQLRREQATTQLLVSDSLKILLIYVLCEITDCIKISEKIVLR